MVEYLQKQNDSFKETHSKNDVDDEVEEWDRHESNQHESLEEELFESNLEVTWDKGSSGLVFYTDAVYWDSQKGDFDEREADMFDVSDDE